MNYIAILDYQRLDNGMFMKSFAEAMGRQRGCSGIILHGDSEYTERLIQTGMMREDAVLRSTRDLNHRVVALLADSGVAGIGINGYQRKIVRISGTQISANRDWLESRPPGTHIILSNLVWDDSAEKPVQVPLAAMADALSRQLAPRSLIIFSLEDKSGSFFVDKKTWRNGGNAPASEDLLRLVPSDLKAPLNDCYLATTEDFGNLPDTSGLVKLA